MEFVYVIVGLVLGAIGTFFALKYMGQKPGLSTSSPSQSLSVSPPPPVVVPVKPHADAVRFLALMQAESRFFDFLMEDITGFSDAQVGLAVRDIHKKSKAVIEQHLKLESVIMQSEGSQVTVPAGYDPSAIRVVGNVVGSPPFTGSLNHAGWRVKEVKMPAAATGADVYIIQPAEVQIA